MKKKDNGGEKRRMDAKFIKIFIAFIVGYILMKVQSSDIPNLLGSGGSEFLSLAIRTIGFILFVWTAFLIITEVIRLVRKSK